MLGEARERGARSLRGAVEGDEQLERRPPDAPRARRPRQQGGAWIGRYHFHQVERAGRTTACTRA